MAFSFQIYLFIIILFILCKPHIEYNTQIIMRTANQCAGKRGKCKSSLKFANSSRANREVGKKFHRGIVDGKNEFKNVSVQSGKWGNKTLAVPTSGG